MLSKNIFRKPAKFLAFTMALGIASVGLSVSVPTAAQADVGGTIGIGSGAGTGGNTASPPADYGGGGYTSTPSGGQATVSDGSQWIYVWGQSGTCALDANGEANIGVAHHIKREEAYTNGVDQVPPGSGWTYLGYYPDDGGNGAYWTRLLSLSGVICVYKPQNSAVSDPIQCVLSTTATIDRVRPTTARLGTGYATSGYTVGSQDLQACRNSQSSVFIDTNVNEYSIVEAQASSKAVWTTWRTYPGTDPRTGAAFAPTLVYTSGVMDINPQRDSLSIACWGKSHPADYSIGDFTDEPCSPHRSTNPSTQCNASPILFDLRPVWEKDEDMRSVPADSMEYVVNAIGNPGRKLLFNQNPSGAGVTINSYRTQYTTNTNYTTLDLLRQNSTQEDVLVDKKVKTAWFSGKQNAVQLQFQGALNRDEPMKLSQILEWSGTREVSSAGGITVHPITGQMGYADTTATVPTSGSCISTATIGIMRPIGDIIN
jgi:hypothetical protein